ncbi:MAG: hypothetical protein K9W46_04600 [Candidatus Heimdallarchaeum endolithica]|uniref:Uncharacterized protein n=1 Tax=Candidatus Heimdallarchaeum endolithica TaxID=2876572 RepID=A0A9Y1BU47_9ARCH|nr:MAG: hypothetical protein K9W46_04600 [Candidatus Heimdallarchaeum endolithica]
MLEKNVFFSPWSYLAFTLIYSWSFWFIAIFSNKEALQFPTVIFYLLGETGPAVVFHILLYLNKESDM